MISAIIEMQSSSSQESNPLFSIIIWVVWLLYYSILESSKKQATWGKRIVGIKVATEDENSAIGFWNAVGRNISKIFSTLILYIGWFMPIWTKKRQTLHDKMASMIVVRIR